MYKMCQSFINHIQIVKLWIYINLHTQYNCLDDSWWELDIGSQCLRQAKSLLKFEESFPLLKNVVLNMLPYAQKTVDSSSVYISNDIYLTELSKIK